MDNTLRTKFLEAAADIRFDLCFSRLSADFHRGMQDMAERCNNAAFHDRMLDRHLSPLEGPDYVAGQRQALAMVDAHTLDLVA